MTCRVIEYRAEDFVPVLACPSQVDNIKPVCQLEGTPIDQVFIGSCTNGRLEDLMAAAEVLKDKHVAPFVKLIVAIIVCSFLRTGMSMLVILLFQSSKTQVPLSTLETNGLVFCF